MFRCIKPSGLRLLPFVPCDPFSVGRPVHHPTSRRAERSTGHYPAGDCQLQRKSTSVWASNRAGVEATDMVRGADVRPVKRAKASEHKPEEAGTSSPKSNIAQDLLDFINEAWTPFHAVAEASRRLETAGFTKLSEQAAWDLKAGGRYYFTRSLTTIVAFAVGAKYAAGNGFHMIGAHTDSPCLKLKPVSKGSKPGFQMVNVEPYGGGLWHTWFDRDLTVAGSVLVRGSDGSLSYRLVKVPKPILRIPMLAIHLQRDIGEQGFKPNKQTHLAPILATAVESAASAVQPSPATDDTTTAQAASASSNGAVPTAQQASTEAKHHPALLKALAAALKVDASQIVDFDLNVCDTQPGVIGGVEDEFVFAGRLDNLGMSFCSLQALLDSYSSAAALSEEQHVKAVALFDHEEVGSASAQGAGGPVMRDTISRVAIALARNQEGAVVRALSRSFLVSADMAHARHPNYADKHEPDHSPAFGKGLVIKHNVNQRYATNALSATLFRELARASNIPTQDFSVRSDMACGSTIGPILASGLGCRTVDVGSAQLAMHSIREMAAVADVAHAYAHFRAFFQGFSQLDARTDLDSLPTPVMQGTLEDVPCDHVH